MKGPRSHRKGSRSLIVFLSLAVVALFLLHSALPRHIRNGRPSAPSSGVNPEPVHQQTQTARANRNASTPRHAGAGSGGPGGPHRPAPGKSAGKAGSPKAVEPARTAAAREKDLAEDHFTQLWERAKNHSRPRAKYAYTCVISNEKYLEGAVTMGWTIRKHSKFVKDGRADLVIIVNEMLHNNSVALLSEVGWDYVKIMKTLAYLSPKSYFTYTFDKMYLFGMVEYKRVIFFDADMLCTGNPDSMFDVNLPSVKYVGAIGGMGSSYFQTGTMIVQPSKTVFEELFIEYKYGDFNYNQWRARDGILLRNYFGTRHVMLTMTGFLHYHGYFKPWFNKDNPPARSEKYPSFDKSYQDWWDTYEEIHKRVLIPFWDGRSPYGGRRTLDRRVTPHTHLWLQRYAKMNYTRKRAVVVARETNFTVPGLRLLQGPQCDRACEAQGLRCREDALRWSSVNGCRALRGRFGCEACTRAAHQPWAPGVQQGECKTNYLHDVRYLPLCNASIAIPSTFRLCPCVPEAALEAKPSLISEAGGDA